MGLGNPGPKYAGTRHNVGFDIADRLAERLGITFSTGHLCVLARGQVGPEPILVVKPMTYMNRSGEVIPFLVREYSVAAEDFLVMYDDMDLPVGRLRLRAGGSSGGHNGMKSVSAYLGTERFPRLRIGIGSPRSSGGCDPVDYVLSAFSSSEWAIVDQVIDLAVEAALVFVVDGIDAAMSQFNSKRILTTGGTDGSD